MGIVYPLGSFGSKSGNRVEIGGAAGRKKAGGRGYKGKDQCDASEDERIIRADLEE
jgi:ribosomal protein L15